MHRKCHFMSDVIFCKIFQTYILYPDKFYFLYYNQIFTCSGCLNHVTVSLDMAYYPFCHMDNMSIFINTDLIFFSSSSRINKCVLYRQTKKFYSQPLIEHSFQKPKTLCDKCQAMIIST